MELVISAMESHEHPTVLFGFHSPEFSQCVYMTVEDDPIAVLKMAQDLGDGLVAAAGEAVRKWKAYNAQETGVGSAEAGDPQASDGKAG